MDGTKTMPGPAVAALTQGERLLLWSFRAWVSGPGHRPMVVREFARIFPADETARAIHALDRSIAAIAGHARRQIVHHPLCGQQVAADEQAVMAVFAALQEEQTGLALRHAAWLVRPAGLTPLVTAAAALALLMAESDLDLPYRGPGMSLPDPEGAAPRMARVQMAK